VASVIYNPELLKDFAARLYRRATLVTVAYGVAGVLIVIFLGVFAIAANGGATSGAGVLCLAFIGGILGAMLGAARAFRLKLEAQLVLCQVQIAEQTLQTLGYLAMMVYGPAHGVMPARPLVPSVQAPPPR